MKKKKIHLVENDIKELEKKSPKLAKHIKEKTFLLKKPDYIRETAKPEKLE